jgi:hypothetical protein
MFAAGNACVLKFSIANLTIASVGAVTSLDVSLVCPGVKAGDVGIGVPRDAKFTNGLALSPLRCAVDGTMILTVVNGSAGAIDPVDTFDFDIFVLQQSSGGNTVAT